MLVMAAADASWLPESSTHRMRTQERCSILFSSTDIKNWVPIAAVRLKHGNARNPGFLSLQIEVGSENVSNEPPAATLRGLAPRCKMI